MTTAELYSLSSLLNSPPHSLSPLSHAISLALSRLVSMVKDDWLTAAMTDDAVVVQLLLRLKHSHASPSHVLIPLNWGLKQPRSRPFSSFRCLLLSHRINNMLDSTRCSPSTPLSWTGRLSSSPTSDASEDSTHPTYFSPASAGSKDTAINASAAATTPTSKRSRKKELAALDGTFKERTANNESFKRMKLNLNLKSSTTFSCIPGGREKCSAKTNEQVGPCHIHRSLLMHTTGNDSSRADIFEAGNNNNVNGSGDSLLPDLNMMPSEIEKCESF